MPDSRPRFQPPKGVREIAATLERAGHETWCVGGAVRDALLGRSHLDWDLATQATPDQVRSLFRRTIPVGVEFGTVGVLDHDGALHEVTTFRRDVRTDGRHAVVEFGVSLDDDLARRDFTINAIAYSPKLDVVHDPFDGRRDLERGMIRAVGVPSERMREDRLRALRALRFAARFEFDIERDTWQAIVDSAPFLTRLSRERVRQELEKTMDQVRKPSRALHLWRRSGAIAALIPELDSEPDVAFAAADFIALPDETSRTALASSRRLNRLTMVVLGLEPRAAQRVLRALRFSNRHADWIGHMVASWHALEGRLLPALAGDVVVTDAQLRRWAAQTGRTQIRDFLRVAYARWRADRGFVQGAPAGQSVVSLYRRAVRVAYRDAIAVSDLAIDGDDLRELGLPPGPGLGGVLRKLLDQVIETPSLNTREALVELVRRDAPLPPPDGAAERGGR